MECVGPITCTWFWLGDNVASIIATCAMAATFWQGYIARKHNRLSVQPHIFVKTFLDHNPPAITFEIINNGLGPGFIDSIEIKLNNQNLDVSNFHRSAYLLSEEFGKCIKILDKGEAEDPELCVLYSTWSPEPKEPILVGSNLCLCKFELPEIKGLKAELFADQATEVIEAITIDVQYSSIYGKKFKYSSNQG